MFRRYLSCRDQHTVNQWLREAYQTNVAWCGTSHPRCTVPQREQRAPPARGPNDLQLGIDIEHNDQLEAGVLNGGK